MSFTKRFSQACENNKAPILAVLSNALMRTTQVLEIGSGSGQHACHFAQALPHLQWQPTDVAPNLQGIEQWREDAALDNLLPARALDLEHWPSTELTLGEFDAAFTANTLHIVSWPLVQACFEVLAQLAPGAVLCVYGPFNYNGQFTSASNASFNDFLQQRDPQSGIRDYEAVAELAEAVGFRLVADHAMPANNRLLQWKKADVGP